MGSHRGLANSGQCFLGNVRNVNFDGQCTSAVLRRDIHSRATRSMLFGLGYLQLDVMALNTSIGISISTTPTHNTTSPSKTSVQPRPYSTDPHLSNTSSLCLLLTATSPMAHHTRQEVLASGALSPTYKTAFEAQPITISGADIPALRTSRAEHLKKLRHLYPIPGPIPELVTETLHDVPTRDGASIRAKVYQPVAGPLEGNSSPLVVMYHEGGWSMGDLTDEDLNCRMFARDLGAVCVNVEYR